jgi:hypothetical protein
MTTPYSHMMTNGKGEVMLSKMSSIPRQSIP